MITEGGYFPVVEQLHGAGSHRQRAQILLRLSDAALMPFHAQIGAACQMAGFQAGFTFITWRVAALCATRDPHGLLPSLIAGELEAWRQTMSRYAAGEGSDDGQ